MEACISESSPRTHRLRLGPEAAGVRLDRALADRLPQHSRTALAAWIAAGRVTVDGRRLPAKARVAGGERVEIEVPPPAPATVAPEPLPLSVVHLDPHLLVVDKPAGLTVHPGSGRRRGTLANALVHHLGALPEAAGADRPGIVHRLDKDTSGLIVVARSERVQRALSAAFARRSVEKEYLACVHGRVADEAGEIDLPLGRSLRNRKRMAVRRDGGREALTRWEIARRLSRHTLLACSPVTGRTHQIRVHLAAIGHPVVGDPVYGQRSRPGEELVARMLLHARRLGFAHPVRGERVVFEAPLPADFERALEALAAMPPARR